MKLIFLTTAALFGFSILTHAHANEKKVDSPSVMDCNNYGNVLVKESGKALAEIGESPVDIRRTVEYYCMKGFRAANEAQSLDEIELWEMASLHELTGINYATQGRLAYSRPYQLASSGGQPQISNSTHINTVNVNSNPQTVDALTRSINQQASRASTNASFSSSIR